MKFLPLVWAAVMRKPTRAILTLLSVMIAFTLFGLTIGMNATFEKVSASAHDNRVYTNARFGGSQMSVAMAHQIGQLPGVAMVAYDSVLFGYHQEPRNRVFVLMADDKLSKVLTEWPITAAQWDAIRTNRTGVLVSRLQADRWHLKRGDIFTIAAPQNPRADGSTWSLKVLDVVDDVAYMGAGYMLGNYDYFNKARARAKQDKVDQYFVQTVNANGGAAIAQAVDNHFANSTIPTQSITEKAAFDVSNSGVDIAQVDRDIAMAGMFMVLFLAANGIAQSVRERYIEFATLKTMGFTGRGLVMLVFLEAAVPCLLGGVLGVGLAAGIAGYLPKLLPPGNGVPIPTVSPMVVAWALGCAALVALLSAALPTLRLARMDIATALSGRT